jgi:hypothetical protein
MFELTLAGAMLSAAYASVVAGHFPTGFAHPMATTGAALMFALTQLMAIGAFGWHRHDHRQSGTSLAVRLAFSSLSGAAVCYVIFEVLPAHEWRFRGLPGRVDAIAAHHERRLTELLAAIRRRPGSTPWQLAGELTWSRPWDQYSGQMRIFAVTETAAHAHLLERRGLVTASRTRPPAYTARAA